MQKFQTEVFEATRKLNREQYEDARLLSIDTDDPALTRIDTSQPYDTRGGIAVANYRKNGRRYVLAAEPSHTLLVGSTGSGKTQSFFMPQIEFLAHSTDQPSMLIMDSKHEIYREKADMLRAAGYEVVVLDGSRPFTSAKYNPLDLIWRAFHRAAEAKALLQSNKNGPYVFQGKDYGEDAHAWKVDVNTYYNKEVDYYNSLLSLVVETMVPVLPTVKDPMWDFGSREIVSLTIQAMLEDSLVPCRGMTEDRFILYNVVNIINSRQDDCEPLTDYVQIHERSSPVRRLENYVSSRAKVTRDSFLMWTINHVNRVVNHSCNCLTCGSDIRIDEVAGKLDKPTAIFLIVDNTNESTHMVCNLFLRQLMTELQHRGDEDPRYDFHVLWDEFATSGMTIASIGNWITTMRSRRVWFHLGVQSYQQLDALYTKDVRVNIAGNAKLIFCGSNDNATLREAAEAFGQTIGANSSYNVSNSGDIHMSVTPANVPVVRVSDLAQMQLGEAYVRLFGNYGNKQLRTVLEPNFRCEDYAHGNATPLVDSAYIDFDVTGTFYDIEQVLKANNEEEEKNPVKRKSPWDFM